MNIVLITVDSLRWDHLGCNGYTYPTSPQLDAMRRHAYYCGSTYTHSPSTTGAFPAIMTSTPPLAYGGFDLGVLHRPPSLATALSKQGFQVGHIYTSPWVSQALGYGVDTDVEETLYGFVTLAKIGTPLLRTALARYNERAISLEHLVNSANLVLPMYFDSLRSYCAVKLQQMDDVTARSANFVSGRQRFRWHAVMRRIDKVVREFHSHKAQFMQKCSAHFRRTGKWLLDDDWYLYRDWSDLAVGMARRTIAACSEPFSSSMANRIRFPHKNAADADVLLRRVLRFATEFSASGRPFFLWTHLFDAHIPYTSGDGKHWAEDTRKWLRLCGRDPDIDPFRWRGRIPVNAAEWEEWRSMYDGAVRFLDHHIGRLRDQLERAGLRDTLIVVTSDHGEELGEHGDTSHRFRLYEHNARVFTIYYHPDFRETCVPGFSSLMDVAPTILSLATGAKAPEGWQGRSVVDLQVDPRERLILETTFGSPSDARMSPVYLAIREGKWKLMYNEKVHPRDRFSHLGARLFDLSTDPLEQVDLSGSNPGMESYLMRQLRVRLSQLHRQACTSVSWQPGITMTESTTPGGRVIWVTGLSSAGKTTVCRALCERLRTLGFPALLLESEAIRAALGNDLGYSEADRIRQVERTRGLSKLLAGQGFWVVVSILYGNAELWEWNRLNLPRYFEVYLSATVEALRARDQKQIYDSVNVVGVDIPWLPPESPDLTVDTSVLPNLETIVEEVVQALRHR